MTQLVSATHTATCMYPSVTDANIATVGTTLPPPADVGLNPDDKRLTQHVMLHLINML